MKYEKSCGAVVFRENKNITEYLLIRNHKQSVGHWGFPKGHVENGETELETCTREIAEETGLAVEFVEGFRKVSRYSPAAEVEKEVVYFLARAKHDKVKLQLSEVDQFLWCDFKTALETVYFDNDKQILEAAEALLSNA